MLALSPSEFGIVAFLVTMIIVGVRLPAWGESLGSLVYRQRAKKNRPTSD
jgi:hypothetical protein